MSKSNTKSVQVVASVMVPAYAYDISVLLGKGYKANAGEAKLAHLLCADLEGTAELTQYIAMTIWNGTMPDASAEDVLAFKALKLDTVSVYRAVRGVDDSGAAAQRLQNQFTRGAVKAKSPLRIKTEGNRVSIGNKSATRSRGQTAKFTKGDNAVGKRLHGIKAGASRDRITASVLMVAGYSASDFKGTPLYDAMVKLTETGVKVA
jgi:hypothetical protein